MKNQICSWVLVGAVACLLNGWALADDMTPGTPSPANVAPGSATGTDSKTQENNPAGTVEQTTAMPSQNSKKHHRHHKHSSNSQVTAAGDTTSKTPQANVSPSTNTQ